jgi:hypothetical protein
MTDQSDPKGPNTSGPVQDLQVETELRQALDAAIDENRRLQANAMAANLVILREALRRVRDLTCEALADAAPDLTIMVVREEGFGDVIACASVSDALANHHDKTHSIHASSKRLGMAVDFIRVQRGTLASTEACEQFLRQLNFEDDMPSNNEQT